MIGGGGQWFVSRSEKLENHKNSTHSKIKLYIIFISIFFLQLILKYFQRGRKVELFFFDLLQYYFINVIIKTLCIISFIVVYIIYFKHSLY